MAETRITAGEWRGRVVDTPSGLEVRPTRSLVRQSLFDILGSRIVGARMLDLYAGRRAPSDSRRSHVARHR